MKLKELWLRYVEDHFDAAAFRPSIVTPGNLELALLYAIHQRLAELICAVAAAIPPGSGPYEFPSLGITLTSRTKPK